MQPEPLSWLPSQIHRDVFSWGSCKNLVYTTEGAEEASLTFTDVVSLEIRGGTGHWFLELLWGTFN